MAKNSMLVSDKVDALLKTNKKGDKQFGLRDAFKKNVKTLGEDGAKSWLQEHIDTTIQFQELLLRDDWVVGDTEATGLGASAEICEIAFQPASGEGWEQIVRPVAQSISKGSEAIHGISQRMANEAPTLKDLSKKINSGLRRYRLAIFYNGDYDIRVASQSCYANGIPELEWPEVLDILPWFSRWAGEWNSKQMGWKYLKLEGGHRALGDCQELISQIRRASSSNVEYARLLLSGDEG